MDETDALLFKVAPPREDPTFHPQSFWRSEDWSSSTHRPRKGYVEDRVLYAGEFDEVNIHLLPKVWRLRVRLDHEGRAQRLRALGHDWPEGSRAVIFALEADRARIESFAPTIFTFARAGFEQVPSREWVAREPQRALRSETILFGEARRRWVFELLFVPDGDALAQGLREASIDHQIQT